MPVAVGAVGDLVDITWIGGPYKSVTDSGSGRRYRRNK